jgi:hypothetical protein
MNKVGWVASWRCRYHSKEAVILVRAIIALLSRIKQGLPLRE